MISFQYDEKLVVADLLYEAAGWDNAMFAACTASPMFVNVNGLQ